ncbi:ATPase RavA [Seminavis robusta]|uniref:ATPase RavA n=1 Tax=Seminavis robusta TaxID=568900 RepID=A0A9N8DFE3_9STRA|nr:ATPase RavA [Seminavis robusta]|eukprot:Sro98_g050600.1 ATPase RavA (1244) ;mRNA; f:94629-98360
MDPLIARLLLLEENNNDNNYELLPILSSDIMTASRGIAVWRATLLKGRLPTAVDFGGATNDMREMWPSPPILLETVTTAMTTLQFPRFVLRHPDTIDAVLTSLLQMTAQFKNSAKEQQELQELQRQQQREDVEEDEEEDWDILQDRWTDYDDDDASLEEETEQSTSDQHAELSSEEQEELAISIVAEGLTAQWGGVISGVQALDQLFGMDHGLLDSSNNNNNANGFGLHDGVWKHSGWKLLPSLQREIAVMPELHVRALIQQLGRRPTAEQSDAIHKFVPRKPDQEGALGAQYDPTIRSSIRGITLSGSLSEMLPSEAMLLVERKQQQQSDRKPLRRLFLAKLAENKLFSYESSGWQDVPSITHPKSRHLTRLPSAPGGPILICLDTSWSMTGRREQLSKAAVLACVAAAHKQKREVQVVAFSSQRNVMETGPITANVAGVQRLLEFLSSSFGGGTDVTGALKHAMMTVTTSSSHDNQSDKENNNPATIDDSSDRKTMAASLDIINSMAAADILLVTDGEIPDPPVSQDVMEKLERLKQRAGVQVHGLLVGKRESVPLAKLCTHIHDFLIGYDTVMPAPATSSSARRSLGALQARIGHSQSTRHGSRPWGWHCTFRARRGFIDVNNRCHGSLAAKFSRYDDDEDWGGRRKRRGGNERSYDVYDEDDKRDDEYTDRRYTDDSIQVKENERGEPNGVETETQKAIESLRASVAETVRNQSWEPSSLDEEKNVKNSCWLYRGELYQAVERISEGLVEREEEARLVVLGMVAEEHVILLGPPGTAKSVLGRRLSQLCGGTFFQRLLTRFTTPEEIFGPLSLRALENDEYRRKTDGFLPTATVGFLDEIFKANSAILNTLLTILNERQFDNGAGVREECPIRSVLGASNELPESDELDALYDRFLLRKEVLPVSDEGILRMLGMPLPGLSPCDATNSSTEIATTCDTVFTDDLDQLIKTISLAADAVSMGAEACEMMRDLRNFMRDDLDVDVSDRRLVKATRLLKVSAACHGRKQVDPLDCLLLQHIVWKLPEQRAAIREWLWSRVTPGSSGLSIATLEDESLESAAASSVRQFRVLLDGLRSQSLAAVRKTSGDVTGESGGRATDVEVIQSLALEASRIGAILQQRSADLARHAELLRRAQDHLWLDPDEATAAKQLLLPRAEAFLQANDQALEDALCLERALSGKDETLLTDDVRLSIIDELWNDEGEAPLSFSKEALAMTMREAKSKYDIETFRKWKRARKKAES